MHTLIRAAGIAAIVAWPHFASADEGVQFELTPYAWLAGIDGTVTVAGREASFERSFSDLVDNVDAGLMGLGALSYNRFVLFGEYDYIDLGADGRVRADAGPRRFPAGTQIDGNLETQISTLAAGYRFGHVEGHSVDVLVGVRELEMDTELRALGESRSANSSTTDTIVMLRPSFRTSDRWRFNPTLSYAVSGDSDTHYELSPQIQYSFSDSFALRFGYRSLSYEESSGSEGTTSFREFDGEVSGALIGRTSSRRADRSSRRAASPRNCRGPSTSSLSPITRTGWASFLWSWRGIP